jgi:hypothetical protein
MLTNWVQFISSQPFFDKEGKHHLRCGNFMLRAADKFPETPCNVEITSISKKTKK